ncbi:MAG: polyprenol monophosphomannose synthase [PVC group bacterium]|nr:polyprenol monophosphomannose synthase [PVC group bacterium]
MKVFAVIPTYNEAKNLEEFVTQIFALQPEFNLIIVDDNSPDGTGDIADNLAKQDPRINVLHRPEKMGLGTAYVTGFKVALAKEADLIFEIDADFSHDPKYLQDFLEAAKKYDLIIGSRYVNGVRVEGWKFRRLLLSKFANMYVSYVMVKPIWDFTAGYRCYNRKVLEKIDLDSIKSDGYAFQIEMIHLTFKNNFSVHEIPILFKERKHGDSKISRNVVKEAFWITLRFRAPFKKIIKHLSYLFKNYDEFVASGSQNEDK